MKMNPDTSHRIPAIPGGVVVSYGEHIPAERYHAGLRLWREGSDYDDIGRGPREARRMQAEHARNGEGVYAEGVWGKSWTRNSGNGYAKPWR